MTNNNKAAALSGRLRSRHQSEPRSWRGRLIMFNATGPLNLLVLAGFLVGCGGGGASNVIPDSPEQRQEAQYVIGPGDSLQIFVWDHQDLSTSVSVRPDGQISTPLVEDLQAAGKSPTQLARDIEKVLAEYVRSPVVTVIMQGFEGESQQQIRVVGQAVEPKAIQYRDGITVLDVMIEVGGLSEFAAGNRARIVRQVKGETVRIRVRLAKLLNDGRIEENVRMFPGDVLIIPESVF